MLPQYKDKVDDLNGLFSKFPPFLSSVLKACSEGPLLTEIVMDLGAYPELRFADNSFKRLKELHEITLPDIEHVVKNIGNFTTDNRAGIERTLHRISCLRNREGKIIGLTVRVGRAVEGTAIVIQDVIESGKNLLFLGAPGSGKTTKLRETARILADALHKRVVVVDTSNEIAGDGDIPHPGIGSARRMQVPSPDLQHATMIEAVENHMPEVIIVDEIGTEAETLASRTIAERGVQLVATAHGNTIENLLKNPTLCDLLGGIQHVVLGDEEAKNRGTQKTVLERKTLPTFDVLIEIKQRDVFYIYHDVKSAVDALLRDYPLEPEIRSADGSEAGFVQPPLTNFNERIHTQDTEPPITIYPYGIHIEGLNQTIDSLTINAKTVLSPHDADFVLTTQLKMKQKSKLDRMLKGKNMPIHVILDDNKLNYVKFLRTFFHLPEAEDDLEKTALNEIEKLCKKVLSENITIDAAPQPKHLRRKQHEWVKCHSLNSVSTGNDANRRVRIYPRT